MANWSHNVDDIFAGDQATALAYATPAGGVVCTPVTNFGQRDRSTATIIVNSSIGMPGKLERIRRNPKVALAFHTRAHGFSDRVEYVLVQGTASLSPPIPDYPSTLDSWEDFDGPRPTAPLWKHWLRVYYTRVEIRIAVERIAVWPDLNCTGEPQIHGTPTPAERPPAQRPPANGTRPRVDHRKTARNAAGLPNVLLGWIDADEYPFVVPAGITGTDHAGILLTTPEGTVPPGGRRAGLTAHSFTRHVLGQHQQINTGWLQTEHDTVRYAPHTRSGHRIPPSPLLYRLAVGYGTRRGLRAQKKQQPTDRQR